MIKKAGDQPAFLLASQEGLEPPTPNLEGSCSIRMSYWLLVTGNAKLVPEAGLEPATPDGGQILSLLCKPFHHSGTGLLSNKKASSMEITRLDRYDTK